MSELSQLLIVGGVILAVVALVCAGVWFGREYSRGWQAGSKQATDVLKVRHEAERARWEARAEAKAKFEKELEERLEAPTWENVEALEDELKGEPT